MARKKLSNKQKQQQQMQKGQLVKWEQLIDLYNHLIDVLRDSGNNINSLAEEVFKYDKNDGIINKNIVGAFNSLAEAKEEADKIKERHVNLKGAIKTDDIEYLDFVNITNDYMMIIASIANVTSSISGELLTKLGTVMEVNKDELDSLNVSIETIKNTADSMSMMLETDPVKIFENSLPEGTIINKDNPLVATVDKGVLDEIKKI